MNKKRYILITGASSGIGKACTFYFAKIGYHVFANVRKKKDALALRHQASGKTIPIIMDVTDQRSINNAKLKVKKIVKNHGLYALINNAGIAVASPLELMPLKEIYKQFDVNVFGMISVTQTFLPLIRSNKGRIINIGSVSGLIATPYIGIYSATKFALESITNTLRLELAPWHILVTIVELGRVLTPIWEKSYFLSQKIEQQFSNEAKELYGEILVSVNKKRKNKGQNGLAPLLVAKKIGKILLSKTPKYRYLIGRDARILFALYRLLPKKMFNKLLLKMYHIR